MKKLLAILLSLVMFSSLIGLSETLYCSKDDATLIGGFNDVTQTEDRVGAFNAMMGDKGSACLITQQELIENLQGYSSGNVRKDVKLAAVMAQSDLYLVCGAETAQEAGLTDLSTLKQYLEENEYGLQIMRSFKATNEDYASMLLMEELSFDSEVFVDDEDKLECLEDGQYVLVVSTLLAMELEQQGKVVLGPLTENRTVQYPDMPCAAECGLPAVRGTYYAIIAAKDADISAWESSALSEDVLAALNLHIPDEGISLEDDVQEYVDYMTAEGLFFY
ncbi:MAG: hypothetical protein K5663_01970 [Clostridiales bacterium]|nr:hypothetical protein [Clostridiales bacterium]